MIIYAFNKYQKYLFKGVLQRSCSEKLDKIHRRSHVLESVLRIWKTTSGRVLLEALKPYFEFCSKPEQINIWRFLRRGFRFAFITLLINTGLHLEVKGLLYSVCLRCFMLYRIESWSIRKHDVTRIQKIDARTARSMFKVRPEDSISAIREYMQKQSFADVFQNRCS